MADPTPPVSPEAVPPSLVPPTWDIGQQINQWDPRALLVAIEAQFAAKLKTMFCQSVSLQELFDLFTRFGANSLTDQELVRVIQIGICFARSQLQWTEASANLEFWLNAGSHGRPRLMNHNLVKDRPLIAAALCGDKFYDEIIASVNRRLKAAPGELFPQAVSTIVGPTGEEITVTPAESVLAAGGEETIYKVASTGTSDDHTEDIYNAVAAVWLTSRVKVKSEKLATGGWLVTIVDWECWFWDDYDWNKEGQSVRIPIDLWKYLGLPAEQRTLIETVLNVPSSALDELRVGDENMLQIEGKTVTMPDGTEFKPKAYRIYGDSTWRFDASASPCSRETVLTITP